MTSFETLRARKALVDRISSVLLGTDPQEIADDLEKRLRAAIRAATGEDA